MRTTLIVLAAAGLMFAATGTARADSILTDRTAFESALSSFTVDGQENNAQYLQGSQVRPDYTYVGSNYGSINHAGTSDNSSRGMDAGGYIWTYSGAHTFTFAGPVTAFGFDFAQYIGNSNPVTFTIGGNASPSPGVSGFFGVIFDSPTSVVTMSRDTDYGLYDNVTYSFEGASTPIPEPGSLALLGLGLVGSGLASRRRKARAS